MHSVFTRVNRMAPEALTLGQFSFASDIYSLGMTLCEIALDGIDPFEKYQDMEVLVKKIVSERLRPQLPAFCPFAGLVDACLYTNPAMRPSAELVCSRLQQDLDVHLKQSASASWTASPVTIGGGSASVAAAPPAVHTQGLRDGG